VRPYSPLLRVTIVVALCNVADPPFFFFLVQDQSFLVFFTTEVFFLDAPLFFSLSGCCCFPASFLLENLFLVDSYPCAPRLSPRRDGLPSRQSARRFVDLPSRYNYIRLACFDAPTPCYLLPPTYWAPLGDHQVLSRCIFSICFVVCSRSGGTCLPPAHPFLISSNQPTTRRDVYPQPPFFHRRNSSLLRLCYPSQLDCPSNGAG